MVIFNGFVVFLEFSKGITIVSFESDASLLQELQNGLKKKQFAGPALLNDQWRLCSRWDSGNAIEVESRVTVMESISLPDERSRPEKELYSHDLLHFGEKPDDFWGEMVMHPVLEKLVVRTSIISLDDPNRGMRRFGGYPLHVQAHPIANANLNASTAGITDWCHLMSFGNDAICELSYGDTGFCGFMTTRRAIDSGSLSFLHFYQDSM